MTDPRDIPVQVLVIKPTPVRLPRGKLTPHQRDVYNDIVRMSRRHDRWVWVDCKYVGSRGACNKLIAKGWIEARPYYGPNGGEYFEYRPLSTDVDKAVDGGS